MIIKFENGSINGAKPKPFHNQQRTKIRHTYPQEKEVQLQLPVTRHSQLGFNNRRQATNVAGVTLPTGILFSLLLVFIFGFVGFFVGYNFSLNRSTFSSYNAGEGTNGYTSSTLTHTNTKTITTSSNSSVVNTNNDADTITNTVTSR